MAFFSDKTFNRYQNFLYLNTGIYIRDNKKHLLQMKIDKAMNKEGIDSYEEYLNLISKKSEYDNLQDFINLTTTNTTEFFRENKHFNFIKENIDYILKKNPRINREKEIRVWSAGCSTGQEAVTLTIVLKECLDSTIKIRILATDIDSKVLSKASLGMYSSSECKNIPSNCILRYFKRQGDNYTVKNEILNIIKYRHFNLMNEFNFKKGFDIIFCRNVMIYFNTITQEKLINKFYKDIVPGGLLFIGHSESLINKQHKFKNIGSSLYIK